MKKCTTIIGIVVLTLCTAAAEEVPKAGVYLGYQYVRFNSATNVPAFSANGAGGQFIYNFNHWFSAVADLGAVNNGNIGGFHADTTMANFLFGPRFSLRHRVTPYFQVLWGGVYATSSTQVIGYPIAGQLPAEGPTVLPADVPPQLVITGDPVTARLRASQTAFAMTAGGGLDIKISKHVSFRPIGLDYYLTRLQNLRTAGDNNQNNLRYSAGVTFLFGGEKAATPPPPPPQVVTKTCPDGSTVAVSAQCPKVDITLAVTTSTQEICPGETAQVTASTSGQGSNQVNYAWSVNGQPVSQDRFFVFTGKDAGTYKVGLTVNGDNLNPSSSETTITVREYLPPTGSVQANPSQIRVTDKSSLSASFSGQCGGTIQRPTFEASEGSVLGDQFDSTGVQFDPANKAEQRKTVTITAKAADNRSVGTATTTIEVVKAATPVSAIRLPDVLFSANSPRVNNCGKRILLEQLKAYYERDSGGTIALVGHSSSDETPASLAAQRALNAAAEISAGSGVCLSIPQSQIQVSSPGVDQNGVAFESGFCASSVTGGSSSFSPMRRVEVWFIPTGGQLPASVTDSKSAAALNVGSLGCPK